MKSTKIAALLSFSAVLIFALTPPAPAQSTTTDFQQAVAAYQQSHSQADAEKVIQLAAALDQLPPIPEEARKHFVMGQTIFKDAKNTNAFPMAGQEFIQAARLAPWWPEARYNLAVARQAEGDYANAIVNLKLYQLFKLSGTEAQAVKDKIYALEAKQELATKDKELAAEKNVIEESKAQREAAVRRSAKITQGELVYWPNDDVLPTMTYSEAKRKIESAENSHESETRTIKDIQISSDMITWTVQTSWGFWHFASNFKSANIYVSYHQPWKSYCLYLSNVKGDKQEYGKSPVPYIHTLLMFFYSSPNSDDAISLANAFYVLKRHAEGYDPAAGKNGPQDSGQ